MSNALYRAWTKAIRSEGPPSYSGNWALARRGWLYVFADRLECGGLKIYADAVEDAVLYKTRQWFIPVYILSVATADGTWQFGLNPWTDIGAHLPFPFRREQVRLKYSPFSVAIRLALLAYVLYVLYLRMTDGK